MAKCFFCGSVLQEKEGTSKVCTPISDNDYAVVEVDSHLFCCECKEHYLDTKQIIKGFKEICNNLDSEKKVIPAGVYC